MIVTNRKDSGFTILEVLIAMFILAVGLMAIASLATTAMKSADTGKRTTQALNLATQKLEALRKIPYKNVNMTGVDGTIDRNCSETSTKVFSCTAQIYIETVDGVNYEWAWTVTFIDLDEDGDFGLADDPDMDDMKRLDVTVFWQGLQRLPNVVSPVTGTVGGSSVTISTFRATR